MIEFSEEKRKAAIEAQELADMRQNNKQHCTKIAEGIDKLKSNSPARAIWELVQNARDLSHHCSIRITLDSDCFQFAHKGDAFTPDALGSLIKQVSSEEKEAPDTVGQYGTGFLTTHAFSRTIRIDGSLQIDPEKNPEYYVDINDFLIDRTFENIPEFIEKMTEQLKRAKDLMYGNVTSNKREWTILKYDLTKKRLPLAENGVKEAIKLMPYVMTLNERIVHCTIIDNVNNEHISFSKESMPDDNGLRVKRIKILENSIPKNIDCFYIESSDGRNKVLLPLATSRKAMNISEIPKLFLFFPLLGTENFGVNYIFHSEDFSPTEPRNGIFLPNENEYTTSKCENNVRLLNDMSDMLFEYLSNHIQDIANSIELAPIGYNCNNEDEKLNNFFVSFKKKWVTQFEQLAMIPTETAGKLKIFDKNSLVVFPNDITAPLSIGENLKYLPTIYNYAKQKYILPICDESIRWSNIVQEWDAKRADYFVSLDAIVSDIKESSESLYSLLVFLKESGHSELVFNKYSIIPNRENSLKKASELRNAESITPILYELVSSIIPESTQFFVNTAYTSLYNFTSYTRKDLQTNITAKIQGLKKNFIEATFDKKPFEDSLFNKLIRFCCAFSTQNGSNIRNIVMPMICQFNQMEYKEIYVPHLSSEEPDLYTTTFRAVVENQLFLISTKDSDWVKNNLFELREFIETIASKEDFKEMVKKYGVFPNWNNSLYIGDELLKNIDIDDELSNLFFRTLKSQLQERWVNKDFENLYPFKEQNSHNVAKGIEDYLQEDNFSNPITIEIIDIIDNGRWKGLFPYIEKNKEEIFFTRVQGENKTNVYKLMKADDGTLEVLAKLSESSRLQEILSQAEKLLEQDAQKRADFEKKYEIGKRIEELIRERIKQDLGETLKIKMKKKYDEDWSVNDIQNGQDIVVSYNNQDIFFIEVKTKWNFSEPAHMSKNQMRMACKKSECYALCCVDLTNSTEGLYPSIDEIIKNIYVHLNIGNRLKPVMTPIWDADNNPETSIRIDGDYAASITKKIFISGNGIDTLLKAIIAKMDS